MAGGGRHTAEGHDGGGVGSGGGGEGGDGVVGVKLMVDGRR